MSTFAVSYCNTTTDLMQEEPTIDSYDRKRRIENWVDQGSNIWWSQNCGYVSALFLNGRDLGAAQTTEGAVNTTDEWTYTSSSDRLVYYSTTNPNSAVLIEGGQNWATLKTTVAGQAADFIRSYINKPIYPRSGVGTETETLRAYDDVLVRANAKLAVSYLLRPYDLQRSLMFQAECFNPDKTGLLDLIKTGDIALSNEQSSIEKEGALRIVLRDTASTGSIVDTRGTALCTWDMVKIKIITGGTFAAGTASAVTYSVWVGDSTSLKISQVITAKIIDGSYQPAAHGIYIRFSPGVYTANDEWELEVSGEAPEAGTAGVRTVPIWRW